MFDFNVWFQCLTSILTSVFDFSVDFSRCMGTDDAANSVCTAELRTKKVNMNRFF